MDNNFADFIKKYDYELPEELIAQKPALPRDSAKLLVYKRATSEVFFDKFLNLAKYLPKNTVLVFNDTKVLPARLTVKKQTGGLARILYLENVGDCIKVMADRHLEKDSKVYPVRNHARASRPERAKGRAISNGISFKVVDNDEKYFFLQPSFAISKIYSVLEKYGTAPIPPYIKNSPLSRKELKEQYQTIFARALGSVAAPTASLHFTKRLMNKLKKAGIASKFITLHVNLGTFAPLTQEKIDSGKLHSEFFNIDKKTAEFLNKAKSDNRPIIPVGTTVARTLESAVNQKGMLENLCSKTDLFIKENYKFKFVDGIVTNFHVPQSSLLMLVSAFTGREKILELYKQAINKKMKFFSFGDGMLIY